MNAEGRADFVRRFENWWAKPDPNTLASVLADDIELVQPTVPDTRGMTAAQKSFGSLLKLVPDLHATVHRWAGQGENVFIEFTLAGTLEAKPIEWDNVDCFTLNEDGRATKRVNYHDSVSVAGKLITNPAGWPRVFRSGVFQR